MKIKELSVFFPAYNEEKNIGKTIEKAVLILPEISEKWELIIINDGSKDKTKDVVQKYVDKNKNIKIINHDPNRGYGAALKSGLYTSKYKWITFTDSDGQFDFSEVVNFIDKQNETNADLVIGYYRNRKVPFYRKINTFIWQMSVFILFGLKVRDIDCGFKLISKKVIDTIEPLESERGAFISSELLIKSRKHNFSIVEIPTTHYPRVEGHGTGASLDVIIQSFIDLFRLWVKLK